MECKNCGYKLKKDENVCPRCGYSFDLEKYKNNKTAAIVGSTLGASGLAAFVGTVTGNDENDINLLNNKVSIDSTISNYKKSNINTEYEEIKTNELSTSISGTNENIIADQDNINGGEVAYNPIYGPKGVTGKNIASSPVGIIDGLVIYNSEYGSMSESDKFEINLKTQLEKSGMKDEEISRVVEAYKLGDQENFSEVVSEINANHAEEYENKLRNQLEKSGMKDEEISRVMEAYKSGDQEKFNEVVSEITLNHAEEYEQNLIDQLKESGLKAEEISSVVDAYKTGDESKVNEVLNDISAKRAAESEKEMRESLAESGLTKEEIDKVVETAKTDGTDEANEVLSQISSEHAKEYEEQLINQLRANNIDENTINRMIQAYRNGDKDGMTAIYAEINEQKENDMREQLRNSGMNDSQIERIIEGYRNDDQDAINKVYAEIAQARENVFIEQLRQSGITNEDDLDEARVAYRSGNQDILNETLDEISNSYLKPDANGDINIPSSFHIEALLSQFGSSSRFSGNDITKVSQGDVTYENFQTQFQSISNEYENGNFKQYDKEGVNKFANVFWDGASYKIKIDNYYKFLGTLKNDLLTLKNTLVKLQGGELNYYNNVNTEMAFEIIDSEGNPNMEFYNQLTTLGITNFGNDGVASQSEIVEFNNDLFSQLGNYYNDGNNGVESYESEKLAVYGQDLDSQIKNYENTASTIVILMNQASIKGLVDMDTKYNDSSNQTLNDFTQAQFNQMCRDNNGNLKFYDMDAGAMQLGIAVFNKEISTSVSNGVDTELYLEYINGITNYAEGKNCNLEPTEYAYTLLLSAVKKEAYTPDGVWRPDSTSQAYKDCVERYDHYVAEYSFKDYLAMNGFGDARTNTGNNVVDLFSKVIGKSSEERLNRSLEYGSNFEEAFYLSREYYDVVSPEFTEVYNDFSEFSKTLSDESAIFTVLDLYSQPDSADLVEQMKSNPLYSHMFDSNGNLTGDYANINDLKDGDRKTILQKEMTEAILQSRLAIKNKEYTNLINQMQLFNTFVPSSYEGVKSRDDVSEGQEKGLNLYLDYVNKKNDINDYLKAEIVSYDEFEKNSELISKYGDYKTYCYSFDNKPGSRYAEVEEYLKATTNSVEEFNNLNNTFNDNIINVALNASQIEIGCTQFHEALLGSFSQESGQGKISEMMQGYAAMEMANSMNKMAMYTSLWDKETGQSYYDAAANYYDESSYHFSESNKFADMKHQYSDLQVVTTDIINNLQHETINFTSKYSYFDDYVNQYKEDFKNYHLNTSVVYDEYNGIAYTKYEWVNENGEKAEVSDEQLALMYLMAEQDGTHIDWNSVDKSISKYTENIKYLQKDEKTNYEGVLNYLMFSRIKDSESFSQQIVNFSNLGFDTEARRRADEYTSDFAAKMFSKLLNTEISDNSELNKMVPIIGLLSSSVEWLFEDVALPALHGVDGFIKSIGYAVGDTTLAIFGMEDKIDFSPSIHDQMWSYIIQNYKDSGGLDIANYYVTQAMISLGNQAIPIAVSCIPGMQGAGMALLGVSAYGNSFHTTLNEFINDGRSDTGVFNAFAYALMDAGAEMFLERFVGRMPGLSNAVSIGVKGLLKDIAGEMVEESLQEFLGPLFKDVATLDIFKSIGKGEFGDYVLDFMGNKVDLEAIRDSAIIAAISSGFMNGAQNGPAIVQSLIMTKGKSSSLIQLLQLQAQAMAKSGFTQEQISEQISINQNAAILNAANLTEISQNLLNNPSFESEFNNWKKSLSKEDPRSEFNIEDYASMRAIQSLTFDTTELAMAQNINNSKIQELLLNNNKSENIIEQINELNTINANISEQISTTQLQAQQLINTNTNTISDLQLQIETLKSQLETGDVEQKNSITKQISILQLQIKVLNTQNDLINLSLADNLSALELTIENNNKLLETLNEQISGSNLEQSVIDVLNKQMEIIKQNQQELSDRLTPARESLAKKLVSEETQLLKTLYSLNRINKENTEDLKSWEKSKYQKIQNQIDQINRRLTEIQNQFKSLEQNGIAVENRTTYESIVKSNQEFEEMVANIIDEHVSEKQESVDESNIITENNSNQNVDQIVEDINFEIKGLEITSNDILSITVDGLNNIATKIKNIYTSISSNISQFNASQKAKLIESLRNLSNNLKNSVKNMSNSLYEATIGKINFLNQKIKENYKLLTPALKNQIKNSMQIAKNNLINISSKIDSKLKSTYDSIIKGIDSILEIFNKSEIEVASESNGLQFNNSILKDQVEGLLRESGLSEGDINLIFNGTYKQYFTSEELVYCYIFQNEEYSSIIQALSEDYTFEEMQSKLSISESKIKSFESVLQKNNLTVDNIKAFNKYSSGSNMILSAKRGVSRETISQTIDAELDSRLAEYSKLTQEQISQIHDYVNGLDYSKPLHENWEIMNQYLEQYGIPRNYKAVINSTVMHKNSLAHLDETLSALDQGLTIRLSESMKLTRAVKSEYLMSQLKPGEDLTSLIGRKIEEKGYSSTSPIYNSSFAKYDDYDVVYDIYAPKGTQGILITPFSSYGSVEEEVLLNSNDLYIFDVNPEFIDENGRKKIVLKCIALSKDMTCYKDISSENNILSNNKHDSNIRTNTSENNLKINGIVVSINELLSEIKYDFINSISDISNKINSLIESIKNSNNQSADQISEEVNLNDPQHGFQLTFSDLEDGSSWLSRFTQDQIQGMIQIQNNRGYLDYKMGQYLKSLFSGEYDIYLKQVNSDDINSIIDNGIYLNGSATTGRGSAPTSISNINLENSVYKISSLYELIMYLKASYGHSAGSNFIDSALILKIPKGLNISDMVYSMENGTFALKPKFIDGYSLVDAKGNIGTYETVNSDFKLNFDTEIKNSVNEDVLNQNVNQIVEDINFEIKGLEITPGDILSINADGLNNIATKIKNIYTSISANISQFSASQKAKLIESLRNLSNNLRNSVKNMSNSLYEATIGKINSLIENLKSSNTNNTQQETVISEQELQAKMDRYNELLNIKNSEEYIEYIDNAKNGYAQLLRSEFEGIEKEFSKLEAKLATIENNLNNQAINELENTTDLSKTVDEGIKESVNLNVEELNEKRIEFSECDLNEGYYHFTNIKNVESILNNGLEAKIGPASKMANDRANVSVSKGYRGVFGIINSFIFEFSQKKINELPDDFRKYFSDIKDFSSDEIVSKDSVCNAMINKLKDEAYIYINLDEKLLSNARIGGFTGYDINLPNGIDSSKLRVITDAEGNILSAFDFVSYLYEKVKNIDIVRKFNKDLFYMMELSQKSKENSELNDSNILENNDKTIGIVKLNSDFNIIDILSLDSITELAYQIDGKEYSFSELVSILNENQIEQLINNQEMLKKFTSLLSEENMKSFIQKLTFTKDVIENLVKVIDVKDFMKYIKVEQISSIAECFLNGLSFGYRDDIIISLLNSESDDIFLETLHYSFSLGIRFDYLIKQLLNRNIDANKFFLSKLNYLYRILGEQYSSNSKIQQLFNSITDEKAIDYLKEQNLEFNFKKYDGSDVILDFVDKLNIGGENVYVYEVCNYDSNGAITSKNFIYCEKNLIEAYLKGDAKIKEYIINTLLSESIIKQNNGILNFDINYNTSEIKTINGNVVVNELLMFYAKFFDQFRSEDKYGQFGANQRVREIDGSHYLLDKKGHLKDLNFEESYKRLVDFAKERYNMPENILRYTLMKVIDVKAGTCTYANLANMIYMKFINNPEGFKAKFGFDMYETINGKEVLNYRMLILDMYIFLNSENSTLESNKHPIFCNGKYGMSINVARDENGEIIKNKINKTRLADDREQIYPQSFKIIKHYLDHYDLSCEFSTDIQELFIDDGTIDIDKIKHEIISGMAQGKIYALSECVIVGKLRKKLTDNLILYSLDDKSKNSTYSWIEKSNSYSGHITTIVGVTNEGFIVASWGKKYLVKFSDLKKNKNGYSNFSIDRFDINNIENVISQESVFETKTTNDDLKTNDLVFSINNVLNKIKYDFINSMSDISIKINSLNKKIIENYKSLTPALKEQIKNSMQVAKNYLISTSSKIDSGLKSTYDSIIKGINSILETFNKPEIEVVSESNGLQLKNSILNSIDDQLDAIGKARKAYIELSISVNYDPRYSLAMKQHDLDTKGEIYNKDLSFRTLEGRDVVCKGWSELYRELLIDLGFDEKDVVIVGGNELGNHKWVQIDLHNGYVLLADAADAIHGTNDLGNCKVGSETNGFMMVTYEHAWKRPKEVINYNQLDLRTYDNYVGYTKNGMYFDEAYKKYQEKFKVKIFSDKVIKNSLLKMEFTEGMDGTDAFVQMRRICNIISKSLDSYSAKPQPTLCFRNSENGVEAVSYIAIFDGSGKNKYLIYSKGLGKIVVSDISIREFENKYGLFYR